MLELYRLVGEEIDAEEGADLLELRVQSPFRQARQELMSKFNMVAQALKGGTDDMPDWAEGTFEWGDATGPLPGEESQA